mgnify:CR=1 FL=1
MKNINIKIAEVTLKILKNKLWKNISISEIENKVKSKSFNKINLNKKEVLIIINNYFDYKLSLDIKNIDQSNNKDMIFEILMMRFDILQMHRKGVISIYASFKKEPKNLVFLLPNLLDSLITMMSYAHIPSNGIKGQLRVKGIFIIYILSFFSWIKDDSNSLEKTMTDLDMYLDQATQIAKLLK